MPAAPSVTSHRAAATHHERPTFEIDGDRGTTTTQGTRLRPDDKPPSPGCPPRVESLEAELADRKHQLGNALVTGWTEWALVDGMGLIRVHSNTTRRQRARVVYAVRAEEATGADLGNRRVHLDDPPMTSPAPNTWTDPPPALQSLVAEDLPYWKLCLSTSALRRLDNLAGRIDADERAGGTETVAHRERKASGTLESTVVLGMEDYTTAMRALLEAVYTLIIYASGVPALQTPREPAASDWGLIVSAMESRAQRMRWPEKNLINSIRWGMVEYSGGTAALEILAALLPSVSKILNVFAASVRKEHAAGWVGPPRAHPPSFPFRAHPRVSCQSGTRGRIELFGTVVTPRFGIHKES